MIPSSSSSSSSSSSTSSSEQQPEPHPLTDETHASSNEHLQTQSKPNEHPELHPEPQPIPKSKPKYTHPRKALLTPSQLSAFQSSETHRSLIEFIETLNESVIGSKLSDVSVDEESAATTSILTLLSQIEQIARSIPAVDNSSSRFGNPAFRVFYDTVAEASVRLHEEMIRRIGIRGREEIPREAIEEISVYFNESWGNRSRIDYGSGMELNFLCWLLCLHKLHLLHRTDSKSIVLRIFWKYIQIMRYLQSTYWLEPAGSHGVWGLDDYHFLPFLWGAAQLRGHKYIRPKSIHDPEIVEEYAKEYIYFACIQFINSIKTSSLRWHSPMLDDISAVKSWDKVNLGMIKMYKAEVLNKLPVMQHFLFGSLIGGIEGEPSSVLSADAEGVDGCGHEHTHSHTHILSEPNDLGGAGQHLTGWGDCCGIPVPSAFGAAQAEKNERFGKLDNLGRGVKLEKLDKFGTLEKGEKGEKTGMGTGMGMGLGLVGKGIRPVPFD